LVISSAVEEARSHSVSGVAQQLEDVAILAPQPGGGPEIASIGEGIPEHHPVNSARGGSADDVDHHVGVDQLFEKGVDAGTFNGPEQFLCYSVLVNRQGNASIQHYPQADLAFHDFGVRDHDLPSVPILPSTGRLSAPGFGGAGATSFGF